MAESWPVEKMLTSSMSGLLPIRWPSKSKMLWINLENIRAVR